MRVEYSANNSGGRWWLKDDDWRALEDAGWTVEWASESDMYSHKDTDGVWRYMGALAKRASKDVTSPGEAIRSFEEATGMCASDEGCNCCGPPHEFSWDVGYASGSECAHFEE